MNAAIEALATAAGLACECERQTSVSAVEAPHPFITGDVLQFIRCDDCEGIVIGTPRLEVVPDDELEVLRREVGELRRVVEAARGSLRPSRAPLRLLRGGHESPRPG
jgi:hypothetical protein